MSCGHLGAGDLKFMGCTVDEDNIFKPMKTATETSNEAAEAAANRYAANRTAPAPKSTTLRDITGNSDEVRLTSPASIIASTKWDFRLQTVAAPGQEVFFMRDNQVASEIVRCTRIHISNPQSVVRIGFDFKVEYSILSAGNTVWVDQDDVFASKADLLASL